MAETSNELERRNPSRELVEWVRSDETRAQIARALPEGVPIDRFERATTTALLAKPELVNADRASLYLALLSAAQAGLVPDGKQSAIVVYKSKVKDAAGKEQWIEKAQFIPMIAGIRDTLAEYGWSLRTEVVCEHDEFDDHASEGYVVHRKPRPGVDRGNIEGAYAMAVHRDGRREAVVMSKADIDKVRDKAARSKTIWNEWYDRMAEKTVGHRLAKKVPLDPKDKARIEQILNAEDIEPADAAEMLYGPDGRAALATPAPPADAPAATPTETLSTHDDGATGSGDGQQTEAAAGPPAAASVPDPDEDEQEPVLFANETVDLAVKAEEVADTEIPAALTGAAGVNQGRTLAEVAEAGYEGEQWFGYAYRHPAKFPEAFNAVLHTYLQGAKPELWAELTAEEAA